MQTKYFMMFFAMTIAGGFFYAGVLVGRSGHIEGRMEIPIHTSRNVLRKTTYDNSVSSAAKQPSIKELLHSWHNKPVPSTYLDSDSSKTAFPFHPQMKDQAQASMNCMDGIVALAAVSLLHNSRSVSESLDALPVQDAEVLMRDIKALAVIGNPEIKNRIAEFVLDKTESDGLRSELIPSIDWSDRIHDLIGLIKTSDSELVRQASISAAAQVSRDEDRQIENGLTEGFFSLLGDDDRLSIINYFVNRNPAQLRFIMGKSPVGSLSESVDAHLRMALTSD
jgi:hypothetical protein